MPKLHLTLEQKTFMGFVLALAVLLVISATSLHFLDRTRENNVWIEHTHAVIGQLHDAFEAELQVEIGLRGFLIVRRDSYLKDYRRSKIELNRSLATIDSMTRDNPVQRENIAALRLLIQERLTLADRILTRKTLPSSTLIPLSTSIRGAIDQMVLEERTLLSWRQSSYAKNSRGLMLIIIIGNVAALILVCGSGFLIHRDFASRRQAETELRQSEDRLRRRTEELQVLNKELEAFSYSVSHDLRAPLRGIEGFCGVLFESYKDRFDELGKSYIERIRSGTRRMAQLIDDLLKLGRMTRATLKVESVDLVPIARAIADELQKTDPQRHVLWQLPPVLLLEGDEHLLRIALTNLMANAWKFTALKPEARIEVGVLDGHPFPIYFVKDNGAGFDMQYKDKLFTAFQRLHSHSEFPGSGVGLALVQRIIARHGGKIWAEGVVGEGATFYFSLA